MDEIFKKPIEKQFEFDEKIATVFDDMLDRSVPFYKEVISLICEIVIRYMRKQATVVDLGCSTANTLLAIHKRCEFDARYVGYDNSKAMLEQARRKIDAYGANIDLVFADILEVEFPKADVVIANYMLQFIRPLQREDFIVKVCNSLKDSGVFIFSEKIIYEDIPSLNKIDYSHISVFEKLIYFITSANKPFSVNIASLSREFGITEPTLNTYLQILDNTGIFKAMRKKSKKISKKPQKLLFSNTNILNTYANKINLELDIGVTRETFFINCFKEIYYSDIGDFVVDEYIFEVGGKSKSFSQIKDIENSFLAIDIDFTSNDKKIPLWLFGFLY